MSAFVFEYHYADLGLRDEVMSDHKAYLDTLIARDALLAAGPMLDLDGGGLMILRADSLAEAQALADADPFTARGVTTGHTLREWKVNVNPFSLPA